VTFDDQQQGQGAALPGADPDPRTGSASPCAEAYAPQDAASAGAADGEHLHVDLVRKDFPLLQRPGCGRSVVYLDSASTTQKPGRVIDAVRRYYECSCANVHRGVYGLAEEATAAYESARDAVARLTGAPEARGVILTRNCTEAINLVAYSWARKRLAPGDELVCTEQEHHSNMVPWQQAARETGATLRYLGLTPEGLLDLERLDQVVTRRTRLVAVTGQSNVLGSLTDLAPIVDAARAVGALTLVDGAQLLAHHPLDMDAAGIDFLALSGHKLLGPTGVGALAARPELLEQMDPFLTGGEMVLDVTLEGATWNALPHKFEAGTPVIAQAIGLGAAVSYLEGIGIEAVRAHDRWLVREGLRILGDVPGIKLYGGGARTGRAATFAFNLFDRRGGLIHPHDVGTILGAEGVAIRVGHHCAKPLMRHLGVPAACRASAYIYNTPADLQALAAGLDKVRQLLG
jgi:cysteine desulfurase/selenocysteine lyase